MFPGTDVCKVVFVFLCEIGVLGGVRFVIVVVLILLFCVRVT